MNRRSFITGALALLASPALLYHKALGHPYIYMDFVKEEYWFHYKRCKDFWDFCRVAGVVFHDDLGRDPQLSDKGLFIDQHVQLTVPKL